MRAGNFFALPLFALFASVALWTTPNAAFARSSSVVSYHYDQVWGAAVRLIRVDQGFEISDQDRDVGYILFDYVRSGHRAQGSLELIRGGGSERPEIRVVVHLANTPSYLERLLLDQLERKLRGDYGDPVRNRPSDRERREEQRREESAPDEGDARNDEKRN